MKCFRMMVFGFLVACVAVSCTRDEGASPIEEDAAYDAPAAAEPAPRVQEEQASPTETPGPGAVPSIDAVTIEPAEPATGDTLEARVEAPEANLLFEYSWFIDGQRLPGESRPTLGESHVRRDRSIHVEVTPVYEGQSGTAVAARAVEVRNSPPEIRDVRTVSLDGDRLTMQVEAHDPDGDPLQYELKDAPDGMRIDSNGQITWTVPEDGSEASYTVVVSDGEREFEYDQTLGFESQRVD